MRWRSSRGWAQVPTGIGPGSICGEVAPTRDTYRNRGWSTGKSQGAEEMMGRRRNDPRSSGTTFGIGGSADAAVSRRIANTINARTEPAELRGRRPLRSGGHAHRGDAARRDLRPSLSQAVSMLPSPLLQRDRPHARVRMADVGERAPSTLVRMGNPHPRLTLAQQRREESIRRGGPIGELVTSSCTLPGTTTRRTSPRIR